jgi:hypothetical protein
MSPLLGPVLPIGTYWSTPAGGNMSASTRRSQSRRTNLSSTKAKHRENRRQYSSWTLDFDRMVYVFTR